MQQGVEDAYVVYKNVKKYMLNVCVACSMCDIIRFVSYYTMLSDSYARCLTAATATCRKGEVCFQKILVQSAL